MVDDDETSREMLARRLRRSGYVVSALGSGLHALSLARRQKFDLVLLDMIMPGLDGFQVLAKFKADPALRESPIIMLSALDEENGIARCVEMGAEDYLAKPFNPTFLRARIGACLEKKRLRDREKATYEALLKSQKLLAAELAEAAAFVRSLLPAPLSGAVTAEWCFHPSEQATGKCCSLLSADRRLPPRSLPGSRVSATLHPSLWLPARPSHSSRSPRHSGGPFRSNKSGVSPWLRRSLAVASP